MKGNAAYILMPLVMVVMVLAGPAQAVPYEHNWSWITYTPTAHNWSVFESEHEQHNWSATVEYKPYNWSNVLYKAEDEHDWSWLAHEPSEYNWSALERDHEPHDWSWLLPEPGEIFNPNAGWWGL